MPILFLCVALFQVFDVVLNGMHTVVEGLDIYHRVGRGVAHDEVIPFTVKNGELRVGQGHSQILGGKVPVEFIKVNRFCLGLGKIKKYIIKMC